MHKVFLGALMASVFAAGPAFAQDFTPAIIFDMGGKFDKSFNEAAYNGAEKFKAETGDSYLEFEITKDGKVVSTRGRSRPPFTPRQKVCA